MYNIQSAERLCYQKYSNSTLVKFDSHEWGNINATRFLGRTFEDLLLEFFYYLLEKKLYHQSMNEASRKHWLRLLLGDKNEPNECVLRYFDRPSGAFTIFHQCSNGGHPICQSEPIRTKIPSMNRNNSLPETITESTTLNSTDVLSTTISFCENCTTNILADEDLINNETKIDSESSNNTLIDLTNEQPNKRYLTYRPLIIILTGPVLALSLLFLGIGLLIRHIQQNRGSYSTSSSIVGSRQIKRSSTILTISDIPNTPAVLYTRLKPSRISTTETEMLLPLPINDDQIEMLPTTEVHNEHQIKE
jgi:hypothetical protein